LLYDYQLQSDEFYDDINSFLNFGEIGVAWTAEENKKIMEEMSSVNDFMERPSTL